ncbi:UMP kinase [Rickettsiales endosymbiont of Stachyamoeba lipophora]|uniref:UMP kinase n=1 Tax=Rickettsiales endosymbiont of Stachyamoeba lipophora TaxID=2486578 RepID=UPI000F64A2EA|nr:UMP kinase [Rickettsiales endosymbiont of Stachyamoeba lipophora]AZL15077.1 UMP kinase [Rickettsiales endosymbiont of Stachyamoeba lipophora]
MASHNLKFKRIMFKVSGEALMGNLPFGHDPVTIQRICQDIVEVCKLGIQVSLVVGGGNIFRGSSAAAIGIERSTADYMGMLATVMNAIALQSSLEALGTSTRVVSAIPMTSICEPYIRRRAIRHMEKGRVVIFAAGTGNPFFTTDTASTLRAIEMNCDALFKGTQVDGVYSADPKKNVDAKHYTNLHYKQVIQDDLMVMDASAITLARDNKLPIVVFSIKEQGSFARVVQGKGKYTLITEE